MPHVRGDVDSGKRDDGMTRAPRLCGAILLFAFAAATGFAEVAPRDIWPAVTAGAQAGDFTAADARLQELIDSGKPFGIRRYPMYAEAAASLAREAERQKNPELVQWALAAATKLDSNSPAVAFTAADLASKGANWGGAIQWLFTGFGKVLSDQSTATLARSDLLIVFSLSLFLTAAAFALTLLFRYGRMAAHDFRETLSPRFRAGVTTVLGFALLFLPIFLWLGPMWLMLYWLLLFFGYASAAEKGAIVVILLLLALLPIMLDWTAYRIAGVETPIVRAAFAAEESAYDPDTSRRLRELLQNVPEEANLHLLAGNLAVQEGNEQEGLLHYRRAIELDDSLAGAHLNIGNLHFFNNDFLAAINLYRIAAERDPPMAIAYYNSAVANGELYKFNEQGQQLAEAKKRDAARVDRLLASPPPQKIVMYKLPLSKAWALTDQISRRGKAREIFGNYASFDLATSALNPVTLGALAALALGVILWLMRRDRFADACIKCGRTFCHRCKSAREAATYCTQCIHIYLKRDGVSVDTKRSKMNEVQSYAQRHVRLKKLLTSFLPGSAQILEGSTIRGVITLLAFLLLISLAVLIGRLAPLAPPAETMRFFVRTVAILLAVVLWLLISIPVYRQRAIV